MNTFEIEPSENVGTKFLKAARLICAQEPGVSVVGMGKNQMIEWVPPKDDPYKEHIELRRVKFEGQPAEPDIWQAEFYIGGHDEEAMIYYSEFAHSLDRDPFAAHFMERFWEIYDSHEHELCTIPPEPSTGQSATGLVAVRAAVSQEVIVP